MRFRQSSKQNVLVVVVLLTASLGFSFRVFAQQTNPALSLAEADRLYDEGRRLADPEKSSARSDEQRSIDLKAAIVKFTSAREIYRQIGNRKSEGHCLTEVGGLYSRLSDHQNATEYHLQAIELFKALNDPDEEAIAIGHLGTTHRNAEEYSRAIEAYSKTLAIARTTRNKYSQAQALELIGSCYVSMGEFRKAIESFQAALALYREIDRKSSEGIILNWIGGTYLILGELREAREWLDRSLDFHRKNNLKYGETKALGLLAVLYGTLHENQKALEYFEAKLACLVDLNDVVGVAETRSLTAGFLVDIRLPDQALVLYRKALASFRDLGRRDGIANTLKGIGGILRKDPRTSKEALAHFTEALEIAKLTNDRSQQADMLLEIGIWYSEHKDQENAIKFKKQSLELYESMGQMSEVANALNQIGISHWSANANQAAFAYFNMAYGIASYTGDLSAEADILKWLQNVDLPPALTILYGKAAVNKLQMRRSKATKFDNEAQKAFLRSFELLYRRLAEQLLRQDRVSEAYQVLNAFKNQQFYDVESDDATALMLELTHDESEFLRKSEGANSALAKAYVDHANLARVIGKRPPTAEEQVRLREYSSALKIAQESSTAFMIRAWSQPPADPQPLVTLDTVELQSMLKKIGEQIGDQPTVVYQYVGNSAYYSLVITPTTIRKVSSPADFYATNAAAQKLWALLQSDKYDPRVAGKELYDIVFKPIEKELPQNTRTILWSLDGNLRYIPMAALFDGQRYLVERYNNVVFTRADGQRLTQAVSPKWTAEAFGSSKAHSVDMLGTRVSFGALPGVGAELDTLFGNRMKRGVLSGDAVRDEFFTRKSMLERLQQKRPVVHIASHFSFRPGDETRSFLLMGDGTPFTLADMKQQKDMFAGVELLTLSACNTAAQQPDASGREVDAFFELAQRLGAQSVMATLWPVADNSTPWLMREFYDLKVNKKQNKAEALRNAQLALLNGSAKAARSATRSDASQVKIVVEDLTTPSGESAVTPAKTGRERKPSATRAETFTIAKKDARPFVADPKRPFAHPFYWSPFVLIGNWR